MAWTKMKTAAIAGAVVILAAGTTTTLVIKHRRPAADPMATVGTQSSQVAAHGLQGRWKGTHTAHPGQACMVNISGNQIEYRGADPDDWLRGTFVADENASPKQLNITMLEPAKSFVFCIYQAAGDKITIAAAEHGSPLRPADFTPSHQVAVLDLQHF
jgi:uncharacterized protein (TIGR03067 family)